MKQEVKKECVPRISEVYRHTIALFGTHGTEHHLPTHVRRTRQTATHSCRIPQFIGRDVSITSRTSFHLWVDTDEFRPSNVVVTTGHDVPGVLQRPFRRTHVGSWHHDAGGSRGPTHGAQRVLVVMDILCFVLSSVDKSMVLVGRR